MRSRSWTSLALVLALGSPVGAQERGASFKVIVHPGVNLTSIDRKLLLDAFLKKVTRWESGEAIHPVDLNADSPVRRKFSESVLGRPVAAVQSYWQQIIFSGRDVPPPELDSDDEVVRFVLKRPGAVGYVSSAADVGGAKVLSVK